MYEIFTYISNNSNLKPNVGKHTVTWSIISGHDVFPNQKKQPPSTSLVISPSDSSPHPPPQKKNLFRGWPPVIRKSPFTMPQMCFRCKPEGGNLEGWIWSFKGPVLENPFNPSMDVILIVFHGGILIIYNGLIIIEMIIIMKI